MSPKTMAELYSRMATTFSDTTIATSRIANKMMFANLEVYTITLNHARDSAKEMARISTDLLDAIDRTSIETAERSRMT